MRQRVSVGAAALATCNGWRCRRGRLHASGVALAAALWPCLAGAAPLTLETALELAVQRSEATRAAQGGLRSVAEASRAAGQLPDPSLRVGFENLPVTGSDRFSTTRDSMTMKRIGLAQEWVSRDKRAARQAEAEASVGREGVQVQTAEAEARLQTSLAYLDVLYAGAALRITAVAEQVAREEFEAGRARLASAAGASPEALQLAAARGASEDDSAELRQQQSTARVALARWIGIVADDVAEIEPSPSPAEDVYVSGHPMVAALARDVEVARRAADVAATARKPNWTWEVSYGQRTGYSDMVSIGVSIPLPVAPDARQDRETAAKLALVDRADAQLAEARRAATAEYRALVSDAQRLRERIDRYRAGVVALVHQRTAAATAMYRSNAANLVPLFEARRAEVDAQRRVLTLQRDLARTQAQLAYRPIVIGAAP
ncbi:MAG: TolC family protein [Hyphomicrobium sp.]|nr:TolC family protein [Hyphomicrobium sp.]